MNTSRTAPELLFLFIRGGVQTWSRMIQRHIPSIEGSVSIVDLILRHIELLDQLISSVPFGVPMTFSPTMPYDDDTFGTVRVTIVNLRSHSFQSMIFVATPHTQIKAPEVLSDSSDQETVTKAPDQKSTLRGPERKHASRVPDTKLAVKAMEQKSTLLRRYPALPASSEIAQPQATSHDVVDQSSPRPSIKGATGLSVMSSCPLSVTTPSPKLAVGGCYDFLVSEVCA